MAFLTMSGWFFILCGLAKCGAILGHAKLLRTVDPVVGHLSVRALLIIAAILELGVGVFCLSHRSMRARCGALMWLSSILLMYRFGRWYLDVNQPCPCLGNIWEWLKIDSAVADKPLGILVLIVWLLSTYHLALAMKTQPRVCAHLSANL